MILYDNNDDVKLEYYVIILAFSAWMLSEDEYAPVFVLVCVSGLVSVTYLSMFELSIYCHLIW